jgi:hypothetical protein
MGAELFHADGQTGTAKLIVIFRNFAKVPKLEYGEQRNHHYSLL